MSRLIFIELESSVVDKQNSVQWIYTSKDNEELRERYDQWAKEYDEDLEKNHDYQAPKVTAGSVSYTHLTLPTILLV